MSIPSNLPPSSPSSGLPPISQPPSAPAIDGTSASQALLSSSLIPFSSNAPRLSIVGFHSSVSLSLLAKRAQDILDALSDPLRRLEIWKSAENAAAALQFMLAYAELFERNQDKLQAINIDQERDELNQASANYNAAITGPGGDQDQVNALNQEIDTYNTAQSSYQSALSTYGSALDAYRLAESAYENAINSWNASLQDYKDGLLTDSQLETAYNAFLAEKSNFDAASATFNLADAAYESAESAWTGARSNLDARIATYNAYVASRSAALNDLNQKIADWNAAVQEANNAIAEMNAALTTGGFEAPTLELFSSVGQVSGLSVYTLPAAGPSALQTSVQAKIDLNNDGIGEINDRVDENDTLRALGGYPFSIVNLSHESLIDALPSASSAYVLTQASIGDSGPTVTSELPPVTELSVEAVVAPLVLLAAATERELKLEEDLGEDGIFRPARGRLNALGGSGASTSALAIAFGDQLSSPYLEETLSRQAFEAFFNRYGVPEASALVDQIGALYRQFNTTAALLSANEASKILGGRAPLGLAGEKTVDIAVALGNISAIQEYVTSDAFRTAVQDALLNSSSLAALSEREKSELIQLITGELGASLLRAALNSVAKALGMPGLTTQILAVLAGLNGNDPLASFQDQLFFQVLLAKEIARIFGIDQKTAEALVKASWSDIQDDPDLTNQKLLNAILQKLLAVSAEEEFLSAQARMKKNLMDTAFDNQIKQAEASQTAANNAAIEQTIIDEDIKNSLLKASEIAEDRLRQNELRIARLREEAFQNALVNNLILLDLDPTKATSIAEQTRLDSLEAIRKGLVKQGLTTEEASLVAESSLNAARNLDGAYNPLGSFLLQQVGTTTDMQALFRLQVMNVLSPTIGSRNATEVAENYGALIFGRANSVTNILTANEKNLLALKNFDYDKRTWELYRNSAIDYLNPSLAKEETLRLGETLLLSGLAGGLSRQGLTSLDNTLGPSAGQSKHATSYPGILG